MTDQELDLPLLVVCSTRSGSMASCKTGIELASRPSSGRTAGNAGSARSGEPGGFFDQYEVVYTDKPIADVPPLDLQPRNMTAMLDAVGKTINDLGARLAAVSEDRRPGSVIVLIATDGMENASVEFNRRQILDMINQRTCDLRLAFHLPRGQPGRGQRSAPQSLPGRPDAR